MVNCAEFILNREHIRFVQFCGKKAHNNITYHDGSKCTNSCSIIYTIMPDLLKNKYHLNAANGKFQKLNLLVITYCHLRWAHAWYIVEVNTNCIVSSIRSEPVSLYFPLKFCLSYSISNLYYKTGPGFILRVHVITNIRILNIITLESK